jgi:Sel1 repeat
MRLSRVLVGLTLALGAINGYAATQGGIDRAAFLANDPPGRYFPGKYFEYKAQFYLRRHDYAEALRLFELAGYWGNKVAQYNTGLMYFNGMGVPKDKARGAAWLGIAAESHGNLADAMLQQAYASLDDGEKKLADSTWRQLDETYGDAVAVRRAIKQFDDEAKTTVGSRLGFVGNVAVFETGPGGAGDITGADYASRQQKQLNALIDKIQGHVTVGAVKALPVDYWPTPPDHP